MLLPSPEMAVVRRELLTVLRKRRSFVVLLCVTVFTTLLVMKEWPADTTTQVIGARMADLSDSFSKMLTIALLAGGLLFLPPLAGAAITTERERDTLSALRLTLLRPWGLVLAKLVNLLGFYTLLVVGTLPVMGLTFYLVGMSWQTLVMRLTVVYASVLAASCCALYCSARFKRTVTAVIAGFVGTLALQGLIFLIMLLTGEAFKEITLGPGLSVPLGHWMYGLAEQLTAMLPLFSMDDPIVGDGAMRVMASITTPVYLLFIPISKPASFDVLAVYCTLWQVFLGAIFFWRAARQIVRSEDIARIPKDTRVATMDLLEARRKKFPYYLIDPLKPYPPIADNANPVMVKELRWGMLGRMTTLVRMGYLMLVLDLILVSYFALDTYMPEQTMYLAGIFVIAGGCLFAPLLLANIFTKEYEQDNIDMLRMTLVRPAAVTLGKLLGGALAILPLILPGAALLMVVGVIFLVLRNGTMGLLMALITSITMMVIAWCCLNLSLVASLCTRRTTSAFLLSYILCVGILVLPGPLAIAGRTWYIENFMSRKDFENDYARYQRDGNRILLMDQGRLPFDAYLARAQRNAAGWSPFTAYMGLSGAGDYHRRHDLPWASRFTVWAISMVGFVLVGLMAYILAVRLFTRRFLPG